MAESSMTAPAQSALPEGGPGRLTRATVVLLTDTVAWAVAFLVADVVTMDSASPALLWFCAVAALVHIACGQADLSRAERIRWSGGEVALAVAVAAVAALAVAERISPDWSGAVLAAVLGALLTLMGRVGLCQVAALSLTSSTTVASEPMDFTCPAELRVQCDQWLAVVPTQVRAEPVVRSEPGPTQPVVPAPVAPVLPVPVGSVSLAEWAATDRSRRRNAARRHRQPLVVPRGLRAS